MAEAVDIAEQPAVVFHHDHEVIFIAGSDSSPRRGKRKITDIKRN